jgi:PIN domain nuclease of toxin-antitoxin system
MLLLDTNIWFKFYWDLPLPPELKDRISAERAALSPVSIWEIATKIRKGRLPDVPPFQRWLAKAIEGYQIAFLTPEIAAAAGSDPWPHQDPGDRLLVHTALANKLTLAHSDSVIKRRTDLAQLYVRVAH